MNTNDERVACLNDLFELISSGHVDRARLIIDADQTVVNEVDRYGETLLTRAIAMKSAICSESILDLGTDPNANIHGYPYIHIAIEASEEDDPTLVQILLNAGADPNAKCLAKNNWSALQHAVSLGLNCVTKTLLMAGADVNVSSFDIDNDSPLMIAARNGFGYIATTLLAAGANPTITDFQGRNARDIAAAAGHVDMFDRWGKR